VLREAGAVHIGEGEEVVQIDTGVVYFAPRAVKVTVFFEGGI
jgi:hypothetical protein